MKRRSKRKITPEFAARVMQYRKDHTSTETKKRFRLSNSVYYRITRAAQIAGTWKPEPVKPGDLLIVTSGAARAKAAEPIILLRRARSLVEKEVRRGAGLRASDSFMLMALSHLEGDAA
jgi:hypothetical protein